MSDLVIKGLFKITIRTSCDMTHTVHLHMNIDYSFHVVSFLLI